MFQVKVKAILLNDIFFIIEKKSHRIDKGTEIVLDPEDNIGYFNGNHFDLTQDEYKISYLN